MVYSSTNDATPKISYFQKWDGPKFALSDIDLFQIVKNVTEHLGMKMLNFFL